MTLSDIPGTVDLPRRWPLGVILALFAGVFWFAMDARGSIIDMERRMVALEIKEQKRAERDAQMQADIAVIKATTESIRELMREERRRRPE